MGCWIMIWVMLNASTNHFLYPNNEIKNWETQGRQKGKYDWGLEECIKQYFIQRLGHRYSCIS